MRYTDNRKDIPVITISLIVINTVIFLIETASGGTEDTNIAVKFGALYTPYVVEKNEWWRLLTAEFVHFGTSHLLSNMISLYFLGQIIEPYYCKVHFLLLYLLSGIGGNVLALFLDLKKTEPPVSAGASGAIFGCMAVFIVFALDPMLRGRFPLKRVLAGIVFALLPGFAVQGIGISAHIGGFLTGLILAFALKPGRRIKKDDKHKIVKFKTK